MKEETRFRIQEYKVYITNDGKEFNSAREATRHEAKLLPKRQIPEKFIIFDILDDNATFIKLNLKKI